MQIVFPVLVSFLGFFSRSFFHISSLVCRSFFNLCTQCCRRDQYRLEFVRADAPTTIGCNTKHAAPLCSARHRTSTQTPHSDTLLATLTNGYLTATRCNTLQYTLQHTATHRNTPQHTATQTRNNRLSRTGISLKLYWVFWPEWRERWGGWGGRVTARWMVQLC